MPDDRIDEIQRELAELRASHRAIEADVVTWRGNIDQFWRAQWPAVQATLATVAARLDGIDAKVGADLVEVKALAGRLHALEQRVTRLYIITAALAAGAGGGAWSLIQSLLQ